MIVSDVAKMCFIHIPKTAGSTVTHALRELWPDAGPVGGKHDGVRNRSFAKVPDDYFVFAFSREPLERCQSWYAMLQLVNTRAPAEGKTPFQNLAGYVVASCPSFAAFVDLLANPSADEPRTMRRIRAPQVNYVYRRDDTRRADYMGKTDSVAADLAAAFAQSGVEVSTERIEALTAKPRNRSRRGRSEREPIDEATRAVVARLYARDYDAFGYELP